MRHDDSEQLIEESELPLEKDLHDVLTSHPQLIPAEDLGLGRLVVVGRESSLPSGYADLVLVDDRGQLCLVEVKKAGNPDTRQVVAQLLDYASTLWGQSLAQFDQGVVIPYLKSLPAGGGADGLLPYLGGIFDDLESGEERAPHIAQRLEQTLETGDFTLVVAAPHVSAGVQRVLEYLNARGQRFFALEVSYFKGPPECFIPRLSVMPAASGPARRTGAAAMERETFLDALPSHVQAEVAEFLDTAQTTGAEIAWQTYGPSIKVAREKTRQVAFLETKRVGITIQASGGFPEEPFLAAAERLQELNVGAAKSWWHTAPWADLTGQDAANILAVILDLISALLPAVEWTPLDPPRIADFQRNDHNLWVKSVPALADLQGMRLRGELRRKGGVDSTVELVPLKGKGPGWRPRIVSRPASEIWPAGEYEGKYELRIDATATPNGDAL